MDLEPFLTNVRRELAVVADPDGANQAVAARMAEALTPAIRMMLLEALSAAADDITVELAPGSVEVRLRGGEPVFVVSAPPADEPAMPDRAAPEPDGANPVPSDADDGPMSRINLRMTEQLKGRIETAADREGRSVNAWLVRAATTVLDGHGRASTSTRSLGNQRFTGWAR